jgi:uncharacterized protein YceK
MPKFPHRPLVFIFIVWVGLSGCGTIRMMPSVGSRKTPKVYSGTRLDLYAIGGSESRLRAFRATPPEYPLIDLPFSFILDTLILPVTLPIATYEVLFGT